MNDKRSDLPCPGIIRSGNRSTSQNEQTRSIAEHLEKRATRITTAKARAINERNNEYLATKRRDISKSIRKPK